MKKIIIWAYSNKELTELKLSFEEEFNTQLTRDYENVWEWIWNGNSNKIIDLNISREHNYKTGEHSKPLRIILNSEHRNFDKSEIVNRILSILKTDLYIGEIINSGRNKEDYITKEMIRYKT